MNYGKNKRHFISLTGGYGDEFSENSFANEEKNFVDELNDDKDYSDDYELTESEKNKILELKKFHMAVSKKTEASINEYLIRKYGFAPVVPKAFKKYLMSLQREIKSRKGSIKTNKETTPKQLDMFSSMLSI